MTLRATTLAGLLALSGCAAAPNSDLAELPAGVEEEDCTTGCGATVHEEGPPPPTSAEVAALVAQWLEEPMDAPSLPLETLLYHGPHTRQGLVVLTDDALPPERRSYLLGQLERSRAAIEVRLIDASGAVRGHLDADGLTLGEGTHLHLHDTASLGEVELSGRVRRVGLHHLWSRW